ncbi:hypothetical protein [Clostridium sp. Cult3]|uniref:hypothetical protein n=1 Tax=Clostridium sp. Cult3 TaxID=2079004 RepID=UPI001F3C5A5B|nr:hypothetical protein [Clostridium sp. Cult3]MCF6460328.1 hypothetical protein [Clostridium sp. Cult3]
MGEVHANDVKELAEILDTITDKIPQLITGVVNTLYSAEAGKNIGQAVGSLYKELVDSGIPEEAALDMAKSYMLSMKDISAMTNK